MTLPSSHLPLFVLGRDIRLELLLLKVVVVVVGTTSTGTVRECKGTVALSYGSKGEPLNSHSFVLCMLLGFQ